MLEVIAREILKLEDREIPPLQKDMPRITMEYAGIDLDAALVFAPCANFARQGIWAQLESACWCLKIRGIATEAASFPYHRSTRYLGECLLFTGIGLPRTFSVI